MRDVLWILQRNLSSCGRSVNALAAVGALVTLIYFTLSNARRFYSSRGNPLAVKGLRNIHTYPSYVRLSNTSRLPGLRIQRKGLTFSNPFRAALHVFLTTITAVLFLQKNAAAHLGGGGGVRISCTLPLDPFVNTPKPFYVIESETGGHFNSHRTNKSRLDRTE